MIVGRFSVGKGQGQLGVPGVGSVGTVGPDGVELGFVDGLGGVFRSVGRVVGSWTMVVSTVWDGTVVTPELGGLADGAVVVFPLGDEPALIGVLGSVPGLIAGAGPLFLAGFGLSHFGQARAVTPACFSSIDNASTAGLSDSGGSFGASSPMAWRALVMNAVTSAMEAGSPSCWYDATSLVMPLRPGW
ncbi:hypothetical protein GCM10009554_53320 [Kribbella koreensis]|uniref:Uncharacterized protein n=1 Tax=Kribbella koreensis TaxID=57909 RepID=A0ABP4BLM0_9ACTN